MTSDVSASTPTRTGYATIGELQMYYEIHGSGGTPLLVLHGGLFNIDLQFGALLPGLAAGRQVIAADFQGHGRTNDIDRPLAISHLTDDVLALLDQLEIDQVDVFGNSVGGAVALQLAVQHPDRIRRAVISSVAFQADGVRPENAAALGSFTVDMIAGTPMEVDYRAKSPHPDRLQTLLDKISALDTGPEWSDADISGITVPIMITVGDCDMVTLEHVVRMLTLLGGNVNGDFVGVPAAQLAVFPGSTHFFGLSRTNLVLDAVTTFLDQPTEAPAIMEGTSA